MCWVMFRLLSKTKGNVCRCLTDLGLASSTGYWQQQLTEICTR